MFQIIKKILKPLGTLFLVFAFLLGGIPSTPFVSYINEKVDEKNIIDALYWAKKDGDVIDKGLTELLKPRVEKAEAATFSIQTGYYSGNNTDNRTITGLGFSPDMVLLKDNTAGGTRGMLLKTTEMPGETTVVLAETDAAANNLIQSLDADGFTIGSDADVNAANVFFLYTAFDGSDCSASGTFCVGSYTGNGGSQSITSVGFQPDLVTTKRLGASTGKWKSSSMAGTVSNYFHNATELASGGIESLDATGFSIGANPAVNANGDTYYYFAFKEVDGFMDIGTYAGTGVDSRHIGPAVDTNLDFTPNLVWVKAANHGTPQNGVFTTSELYGDRSSAIPDGGSTVNIIQSLEKSGGGFEIGAATTANSGGINYYYAAFGGAPTKAAGTDELLINSGSYTGTGAALGITGLGFSPDLIIVKNDDQATDQHSVFRTSLMSGDRSHYLGNGVTAFTGAITAIGSDGFTLGTNATVNTLGDTYYWTAFGNAMRPDKSGGSPDFLVGQYIGTSRDSTNIDRLPMQPDIVTLKRVGASTGVWRTSNQSGDQNLYFSASALTANVIQSFTADGFQIGASVISNSSGDPYDYFAFKDNEKFMTGTYTGNATVKDIAAVGFQPDHIWIKKTTGGTARAGVFRTSAQTGDATQPFTNLATFTGGITDFIKNGFSLGTVAEVNEAGGSTYQYAAWDGKNYAQQAYRFFGNADSADVGSALAAQDTPATLSTAGQEFRLRLLTRVDNGNLYSSSEDFKLQYVDMGAGTCASPSGGTPSSYTDVTGATLVAYKDNATPTDGIALVSNANDPTDGARTIVNQTYEELNDFTNSESAVLNGQTAKFDFSLVDNGATASTTFCFRIVKSDDTLLGTYTAYPEITIAGGGGALSADIVDAGGTPVGAPTVAMSSASFSFNDQISTGSFGTSGQKIRVDNGTGTATWTLSLAPNAGATSFWDGASSDYDFNDPTAGALDGGDTDSLGGQMTVDPSTSTITPEGGCTLTNISSGSSGSFNEGVTNSITLASAATGADTGCYWDITDIDISQTIPPEQASGNYSIDMTLSIIAS